MTRSGLALFCGGFATTSRSLAVIEKRGEDLIISSTCSVFRVCLDDEKRTDRTCMDLEMAEDQKST